MKFMHTMSVAGVIVGLAFAGDSIRSDEHPAWPAFEQIVESIESHLPDVDRTELNAAIVQALLDHFHPRVILVPDHAVDREPGAAGTVNQATVFDRSYGYLRVGGVGPGLDERLRDAVAELESKAGLQGLVLDLRFAGGQDYLAAAQAADLFVAGDHRLVSWMDTVVHATTDQTIPTLPVVVLINRSTSGAAEAMAGAVREAGAGLLVGNRTAGRAYVFRDVELPQGRILRVASEPVLVGESRSLAGGLTPDIEVQVSLADEKQYLADPYAVIPGAIAGTAPRAERARINEAELMREHQRGIRPMPGPETTARVPERAGDPVVQDPALVRGLDLLKGIAIVGRRP